MNVVTLPGFLLLALAALLPACGAPAYEPTRPAPAATSSARAAEAAVSARLTGRQRWAVVVGISRYADAAVQPLEHADDDARAFADFLRSPAAGDGGVPEENVLLLTDADATARAIRGALVTFLHQSGPSDAIYVFLAGHGANDPDRPNDIYFLPYDADLEELSASAVLLEEVYTDLARAEAHQKIVLADASRSRWVQHEDRRGVFPNPVNRWLLQAMSDPGAGFVAFTASAPGQPSREGRPWRGHGVFTHVLLSGLKGAADLDRDRVVTLGEVIRYTRGGVRQATDDAQVPTASRTSFDADWPMAVVRR